MTFCLVKEALAVFYLPANHANWRESTEGRRFPEARRKSPKPFGNPVAGPSWARAKIKRTFPIPPFDLFVFIRVIRGLSHWSVEYLAKPIIEPMALRDIFKFRELPDSETSKPFLEHLEDLRWTIVKMAITLVVAMIICFAFRSLLVRIMQAPLRDVGSQVGALKALGITDSIVISFHLAFYAGIVISFPLLLYFLAEFVLPALTAVEKRFLLPAIFVSFALFLLGVFVCYFWLLPKTILFFFRDTESLGWAPTWTVQQYYSFATRFTIGFGLAFELPVVVLALVRFGLITHRFMARTRPYAIVLIFILATIITPTPDILTLIAMGLPMCLLYESCIWIAWFMERRSSKSIAA
ncbi:MAG: twin-arginine translocase subunit TatC [Verrucomicrobia bacterium]|nr:MAG: twin-arginine translocase subunit TatC [Verrucomicrobiota bacterium]